MMNFINLFITLASVFTLVAGNPLAALHKSWDDIPASTNIEWHACPLNLLRSSKFLCMRLEVPLDHEATEQGSTTIVFIKSPASSPSMNTKDILINFGGPGSSGIKSLVRSIRKKRAMIGPSHNIISFDPRGIGLSGPNTDCFQDDPLEAIFLAANENPNPPSSPKAINQTLKFAGEWGIRCQQTLDSAARYIGTVAVARDMLSFAERQAVANGYDPTEAVVNFLGLSYGTTVGATFATLYPERTGHMVLDGVVDGESYYAGIPERKAIGVDEVMRAFFRQCSTVGPQRCSFWAGSPEQVETKLDKLLEKLRQNPIKVEVGSIPLDNSVFVSDVNIRELMKSRARKGFRKFKAMAELLADVEAGSQKGLKSIIKGMRFPACSKCTTKDLETLSTIFGTPEELPFHSSPTSCTDADARYNITTPAEYEQALLAGTNLSKYAGDLIARKLVLCRKWPFRSPPSQRFNGTYSGRTKTPILILSNRYDVATPFVHAQKMETQFQGSVLLQQDAVGHCTTSPGSKCISRHMQQYFENGTMPLPRTVCVPEIKTSFEISSSLFGRLFPFPELDDDE